MVKNTDRSGQVKYATALCRLIPDDSYDLPTTVKGVWPCRGKAHVHFYGSEGATVGALLDGFPDHVVLLGAPGAGKSYALRSHAARMARRMLYGHPRVFEGTPFDNGELFSVPIFIDLKRYAGSLEALIMPIVESADLQSSIQASEVGFLVDSFNEAPRQYRDNGLLQKDIADWKARTSACRWVIASRNPDGLDFFGGEHFNLSDLDANVVRDKLAAREIELQGRHAQALFELLRKPIFLTSVLTGRLRLQKETHPADAIASTIESYVDELGTELRFRLPIIKMFGKLARQAIDSGDELFSRTSAVAESLPLSNDIAQANNTIDRLVRMGLLLDYGNDQFAFYHQSITELIAAKHIAEELTADLRVCDALITKRTWDYSLQLVTHFLDEMTTRNFVGRLIDKDIILAGNIVRLADYGVDELVACVFDSVMSLAPPSHKLFHDSRLFAMLTHLPVSRVHLEQLQRLLGFPAYAGGAAAKLLVKVIEEQAVPLIIDAMLARQPDWTFGSACGKAVSHVVDKSFIDQLFSNIGSFDPSGSEHSRACMAAFVRDALSQMNSEDVVRAFWAADPRSPVLVAAIDGWALQVNDIHSIGLLLDLVVSGHHQPIGTLSVCELSMDGKNIVHSLVGRMPPDDRQALFQAFKSSFKEKSRSQSAVRLVHELSHSSADFADWRDALIQSGDDVISAVLLSLIPSRKEEFWDRLAALFENPLRRLEDWECGVLRVLSGFGFRKGVDWTDREDMLLRIIDREDSRLADPLIANQSFDTVRLTWEDVQRWLPWMRRELPSNEFFVNYTFSGFVGGHADHSCRLEMIRRFNDPDFPYRAELADHFMPRLARVTMKDLSDEATNYVLFRMHSVELRSHDVGLLGQIADEQTVEELLLPKLSDTSEPFNSNLRQILEHAGTRHGRRYL